MGGKRKSKDASFKVDGYEYYGGEILIRKLTTKAGIRYQVDLGRVNGPKTSPVRYTVKTAKEARERAQEHINQKKEVGSILDK